MITRSDYMNDSNNLHSAYYAQYVTPEITRRVIARFGLDNLKRAYAADPYLNSIPLGNWDAIAHVVTSAGMKERGDYLTLAGQVCILKEAARLACQH